MRTTMAVGSFLVVFGTFMTSLGTKYWHFFLAQGVCVGIGLGIMFIAPSTSHQLLLPQAPDDGVDVCRDGDEHRKRHLLGYHTVPDRAGGFQLGSASICTCGVVL